MRHTCHWPGCTTSCPPKHWGCRHHWYRLPHRLRQLVWMAYVPGQEIRKDPSPEYLAIAAMVRVWALGSQGEDLDDETFALLSAIAVDPSC